MAYYNNCFLQIEIKDKNYENIVNLLNLLNFSQVSINKINKTDFFYSNFDVNKIEI